MTKYRNLLSALVISSFLFITIGCGNKKSNSSNKSADSTQTKDSAQKSSPDKQELQNTGDYSSVGNFSCKINSVSYENVINGASSSQKAEGTYIIFDVSFKNADKVEHTIDNSLFKLTDKSGKEYKISNEGSGALESAGKASPFFKQCAPNTQQQGLLCFDVPAKGDYDLHLSDGSGTGKTIVVKLK